MKLMVILQVIHPRLQRHVKSRLASLEKGEGIDWATAEVCGFRSLERNIIFLESIGIGVWCAHARWM